jgi:hypothetical protein
MKGSKHPFRDFGKRAAIGFREEGTGNVNDDGGGKERLSRTGAVPADRLRRRIHRR